MSVPPNVGPRPPEPPPSSSEPPREQAPLPPIASLVNGAAIALLFPNDPDIWNALPLEIQNRLKDLMPSGNKSSGQELSPQAPQWTYRVIDELATQLKKALDDLKKTQVENSPASQQEKAKDAEHNLLKIQIFKPEKGEPGKEKKELEKLQNSLLEVKVINLKEKTAPTFEVKALLKEGGEVKDSAANAGKEKLPPASSTGKAEAQPAAAGLSSRTLLSSCEKIAALTPKLVTGGTGEARPGPVSPSSQPAAQAGSVPPGSSKETAQIPAQGYGVPNRGDATDPSNQSSATGVPAAAMVKKPDEHQTARHHEREPVINLAQYARSEHRPRTEAENWNLSNAIYRIDGEKITPAWIGLFLPEMLKEGIYDDERLRSRGAKAQDIEYKLADLLFMFLSAAVCGARGIGDVISFIESKEKFFTEVLGLRFGIPSRQTLWWAMASFEPTRFHGAMAGWLRDLRGMGKSPLLPFLSVWESTFGLLLGQSRNGSKSVREQALPEVIEALGVSGSILLSDLKPLSGKTAKRTLELGGEYVISIDDAKDPLFMEIEKLFEHASGKPGHYPPMNFVESYIEGQERVELAEMLAGEATHPFHSREWHGLRSLSRVIYEPVLKEKEVFSKRFCLSSLPRQADYLFDLLRLRRGVENRAEWLLSLTPYSLSFDQLAERGAANLKLLWRYTAAMLSEEKRLSGSIQAKRTKAFHDPEYLLGVINACF